VKLSGQHLLVVWPSCPPGTPTPGYATCILFQVFHKISFRFLSTIYCWLCTMNLFFIQQYIVAMTSQRLTEIQNTVNSSPITLGKIATNVVGLYMCGVGRSAGSTHFPHPLSLPLPPFPTFPLSKLYCWKLRNSP